MKFTLFQNFNEVLNTVPIEQIVTEIKEGTYKSQILYLRKSLEQGKMEPYEKVEEWFHKVYRKQILVHTIYNKIPRKARLLMKNIILQVKKG